MDFLRSPIVVYTCIKRVIHKYTLIIIRRLIKKNGKVSGVGIWLTASTHSADLLYVGYTKISLKYIHSKRKDEWDAFMVYYLISDAFLTPLVLKVPIILFNTQAVVLSSDSASNLRYSRCSSVVLNTTCSVFLAIGRN